MYALTRLYNFFGLKFSFDNVAIHLGDFEIYWYGILIATGFLLALIYGYRNAKRFGIDRDAMLDVVIAGMVGAIICARAYYIIFDGVPLSDYGTFGEKMKYICGIHNGGIAIYGGVIGAFVCGGLTARIKKIKVLDMFDLAAIGFPIGQAIGRWGNFVNQEVYGKVTGSDWFGIAGDRIGEELVHPLFLYESLWCLIIFIILHNLSKKRTFSGQLFLAYIATYAFGRFWFEGMRNTEFILMFGKISISQLVSVAAFIAATVLFIVFYRRAVVPAGEYEGVFGKMCDDEEVLAQAYILLGCEQDATDDEIKSAYSALREKYQAMIPEESEQPQKLTRAEKKEQAEYEKSVLLSDAPDVQEDGTVEIDEKELGIIASARLSEVDEAYEYICANRALTAAERDRFEQETEDTDDN